MYVLYVYIHVCMCKMVEMFLVSLVCDVFLKDLLDLPVYCVGILRGREVGRDGGRLGRKEGVGGEGGH